MKRKRNLTAVVIISIVIVILALGISTSAIGYSQFTSVLEQVYNDNAYEIAETARGYLNPDKLEGYVETGETDEEYDEILARLDQLVVSTNCSFIYVAKIDPDNLLRTTYIFDSLDPNLGFDRYPLGYTAEDMDETYLEDIQLVLNGGRTQKYAYSYNESGAHTTAALSVADSAGKIVAMIFVEKPMTVLYKARGSYLVNIGIIAAIVMIVAIILFGLFMQRLIVRPVKEITNEAMRFADNHDVPVNKLQAVNNKYEIGILAESINKMENDIKDYIVNITQVTAEKERIGAELNIATKIQADMLPRIFPAYPERDEFDLYASMDPAKEVGGDFYDFFFTDENHICLVMADVSGKGVPAALFMVIAKTLIKNRAQLGESPSQILGNVNNQLCEGNEAELFVTVWLAVLDLRTGKGMAANAGHEHPAIRRAGGKYELSVYRHSPAVAAMEGMKFREHEFELNPGDTLFVYTDGVPEATNANDELFGSDRMVDALNSDPNASPEETLINVRKAVDEFVGDAAQFDDLTMLNFVYNGPSNK